MTKRIPLAVALAAFAMACSDPTMPTTTRMLQQDAPSFALLPHQGYPFPSSATADGLVRLCKVSNVAGTFNFSVTTPSGASQVSITVSAGQVNTPVCRPTALYNSNAAGNVAETVTVVEDNPGANWAVVVDVDQYWTNTVNYGAVNPLGDTFNNTTRTATVVINDDLEKLITFRNTFTPPPPPVCDFITFGRLDWEHNGLKVVISGNAGGNAPDGGFLNEFHIEVNGVDHHVADITSYGPIAAAPLASATYTNSRRAAGLDKHGHSVELRVWDGGEPGWKYDRFWFNVNGTIVGNAVTGDLVDQGNMQYHANCRGPGDE
jgi:hypothetical protein